MWFNDLRRSINILQENRFHVGVSQEKNIQDDKFKRVSTSFMELDELFEDHEDLLDEKNQTEFYLALCRISMKYRTGNQ